MVTDAVRTVLSLTPIETHLCKWVRMQDYVLSASEFKVTLCYFSQHLIAFDIAKRSRKAIQSGPNLQNPARHFSPPLHPLYTLAICVCSDNIQ